jgi:hypothetical protein
MSRLIARILLAIFVIPIASLVYIMTFVVYENSIRRSRAYYGPVRVEWAFIIAGAVSWAFVGVWWFLLWRKSVRWSNARIALTGGVTAAALFAGVTIAVAVEQAVERGFGSFIGSVAAPMLWLVGSIFVWRETAAERVERAARASGRSAVTCPTCGYNLTGLSEARCPECGRQFTLDQLLAVQRDAGGGGELEG